MVSANQHRIEHDSMGEVAVPTDALWGAQTQRAVEKLQRAGYALYFVAPTGREYGFVRRDRIE